MKRYRLFGPVFIATQGYKSLWRVALLCLPLLFVGCSQQPVGNSGMQLLQRQLAENYPDINLEQPDEQERTKRTAILLSAPLTPRSATQLMLLNSPHLQVELARLGVAEAARVQAGLIANPRLSMTALAPDRSGPWQWDLGLTQPLLELLTRPLRQQQATSEWMAAQLQVTYALQVNIYKLQQEYFAAIAAKQHLLIEERLLEAASAKQQLAESLFKAGNISELDYLSHLRGAQRQERALVHQQEQVLQTHAELHYLLGLNPEQEVQLPELLPALPNESFDLGQLTQQALHSRMDIELAKLHRQQLLQERELIRREYGLADGRVGLAAQKEKQSQASVGPQVELTLPLFDRGQAKLASVNAQLASAEAELVDARLHTARDIKKALAQLQHTHRTQLQEAQSTALRQIELAQREVNFMLSSPFSLLDLKIDEIELQRERTSALLSYWQARSQLELALGRSLAIASHEQPATAIETERDTPANHKGHKHD